MALYVNAKRFGASFLPADPNANPCGGARRPIARNGEPVYLTAPQTVYFGATPCSVFKSAYLSAGGTTCNPSVFGTGISGYCSTDVSTVPLPGNAAHVADQDQGFQVAGQSVIYYGQSEVPAGYGYQQYVSRVVPPGSYVCNNANFGPDPGYGARKKCFAVQTQAPDVSAPPVTYYDTLAAQADAQARAQAAAQAQRDLAAAQAQFDQQQADAAAAQAQATRDAAAQAAAAQAAAEQYRQIQKQIQDQATAVAAQIAALAAQQAGQQAAEAAATQIGVSQATSQAIGDEYAKSASYGVAAQAATTEAIGQAEYQGALSAVQQVATSTGGAAPGAAGTGLGSLLAGFDLKTMLIVGSVVGVGILIFGVPGQKKGKGKR